MQVVEEKISIEELKQIAEKMYGDLVKAVVDVEKEIMVVDADLHADEEYLLLELGSNQKNLWGINIHPNITDESWIEFDSMINLRPSQRNRSRYVDDPDIREKIIRIVNKLVAK